MIIPVLMYHSVQKASGDYLTVSRETFYRQVAFLAEHQTVISMHRAADALEGTTALPANPVVLSFDDALKDNIPSALPVLEEFRIKAIFFVIAGYLGQDTSWDHKAYTIADHMTLGDLRQLRRLGHDIGSHSLTHQRLTKLTDDQAREEFTRSAALIEEGIGYKPEIFAYPYGDADERIAALCRANYKAGFTSVRAGHFNWTVDRAMIRRIYVSPDDGPDDLLRKLTCYRSEEQHG